MRWDDGFRDSILQVHAALPQMARPDLLQQRLRTHSQFLAADGRNHPRSLVHPRRSQNSVGIAKRLRWRVRVPIRQV